MNISEIIVKERLRKVDLQKVKELAESIKEIGLLNPIVVTKDNVLVAGNHRLEAFKLLGYTTIHTTVTDCKGLLAELAEIDENLIRNELHFVDRGDHLSRRKEIYETLHPETKRGISQASGMNKFLGNNVKTDSAPTFVTDTANKTNRSETVIKEELQISKNISSALKEQIKESNVTKSDTLKIARMQPEQQKAIVDKIAEGAKSVVDAHRLIKKDEVHVVPEINGKYRVIYADCPWQYGDKMTDGYGTAENHYPTMSIAELCELPIKEMAEDNAVMFFWVTSPLLEASFEVIKAWGFKYKTSFVWDKVKHNMGHYNSVRHELLLICTCGSCTPDNVKLFDSVVEVERTNKHSQKPEEFRNIIDTLYTNGKKIELFSRTQAEGWEMWGNQS